jgi:aldose 1-epimerase
MLRKPARRGPVAQARLVAHDETGWRLIQLRVEEPARGEHPARRLEALIAPSAGSNLFSLAVDGHELMYQPDILGELDQQRAGTPILFPTPNRVRDSQMSFEGRTFRFPANSEANFIHGLVRRVPWRAGTLGQRGGVARAETSVEWHRKQPDFDLFPIPHRLSIGYALDRNGLRFSYRVENRDRRARLPFGFGLHPYFRVPADRAEVRLQVPLARRMESERYLPTGKLLPVAGTAHDLRKLTPLPGLALDDVYFGLTPPRAARFQLARPPLEVRLSGSAAFTHVVVYTPPDRPFFCVENQTCATDAHNLHAAGKKQVAHLLVVAPGKTARGYVDWKIKRLAPTTSR